jgi:hypothetical protein
VAGGLLVDGSGNEAGLVLQSFGSLLTGAKVHERTVPPSTAFLQWAVKNPDRLN